MLTKKGNDMSLKITRSVSSSLALLVIFGCLGGCAGNTKRFYTGPQRPPNEVAIVKASLHRGWALVSIDDIPALVARMDGRPVNIARVGSFSVEVPPGKHAVIVTYLYSNAGSTGGTRELTFVAEAGRTYRLDTKVGRSDDQGLLEVSASIYEITGAD